MDILNMDKNVTKSKLILHYRENLTENWRTTKSSKLFQATDNLSVTKKGIYSISCHSLEELVAFQFNPKKEE